MNVFELLPFLAPLPAMLLYRINTKKLNRLTNVTIIGTTLAAISFCFLNLPLPYHPTLILQYVGMFDLGFFVFRKKYNYLQAASIAYCILFFNIFYWESPIYLYTFAATGHTAAWTNLAPLGLFPMTFIYYQIGAGVGKKRAAILASLGLIVTSIFLIPAAANSWLAWAGGLDTYEEWVYVNILWVFPRTFCYAMLLKIFFPCKREILNT